MPFRKTTVRRRRPVADTDAITAPRIEVAFFGNHSGFIDPENDLLFGDGEEPWRKFWRRHRRMLRAWWRDGVPAQYREPGLDYEATLPHPDSAPWAEREFDWAPKRRDLWNDLAALKADCELHRRKVESEEKGVAWWGQANDDWHRRELASARVRLAKAKEAMAVLSAERAKIEAALEAESKPKNGEAAASTAGETTK
jgi:hypothetical protein